MLNQLPLFDASKNQLQHHVIREQDIGRMLKDLLAFLFVLLPCLVRSNCDRILYEREKRYGEETNAVRTTNA